MPRYNTITRNADGTVTETWHTYTRDLRVLEYGCDAGGGGYVVIWDATNDGRDNVRPAREVARRYLRKMGGNPGRSTVDRQSHGGEPSFVFRFDAKE